ncbi:permease-like cell division protein FtsX [uncultured Amnibacterium sp.]|uniref:permease-like cell division protein FtsX n=1 Tax=uncultured Amnibacterium sp. TaxID=1631851 RepID=UPI0035CA1C29
MRLGLVLAEAGQGLRRNFSMVVSIVLVTFVSLTFVGTAVLLQMQIGQMKSYWYDKAQVAVYLCNGEVPSTHCGKTSATKSQIAAVGAALKSPTLAPFIKRSYFETQQQAYKNFQTQFKGNPVADIVTPDLLNQAYWINLKDPSQSLLISETVGDLPGVDAVTDQRRLLDQIFGVLNTASLTAAVIATLMLVAAALLISTTIRLSAFSRRKELGIMRLVGASNRFIQTPFVLEGVLASLIGSVLAGLATIGIVQFFVQGYLAKSESASIAFVTVPDALVVVPILIVLGIVLAAVSANIAISRYLRV